MKKITFQMRTNIIAAIFVLAFLITLIFLYLPSTRKINNLKNKLSVVQSRIRKIEGIFNAGGEMKKGREMVEVRYRLISSKFPSKEEEALGMLSDIAKNFNSEVYSVSSRPKEFILDKNGKRLEVKGKFCQTILISMKIKASYRDLIEYIDALKESLPAYITIESLTMRKDVSGSSKLHVNLSLILYLLV